MYIPQMVTRDTNPRPSIPGERIRLEGRKRTTLNCRDEVATALTASIERHGDRPFAAREVYAEMTARGTNYAELSTYKTVQRMKSPDPRLPFVQLERVASKGFRLISA